MAKDVEKTRLVKNKRSDDAGHGRSARPVRKPISEQNTVLIGAGASPTESKKGGVTDGSTDAAGAPQATAGEAVCAFLVVVSGSGRGQFRGVFNGMNTLGRSNDQRIPINFGDETISRDVHAYIVYDDEERTFFIQHSGQANIVRLNGKPVLQSTGLSNGDVIRIGRTELKFVPFCGPDFDWKQVKDEE